MSKSLWSLLSNYCFEFICESKRGTQWWDSNRKPPTLLGKYSPNTCQLIITARKRSLGQGNIFTPVCHSVHRGACMVAGGHVWFYLGGCAWLLPGGHVWLLGGVCVVLFGGHAWLLPGGVHGCSGGMRGFIWGACMVLFGGVCMVLFGGMRGFFSFFRYNEIRSMSGRYASYWNASLFILIETIFLLNCRLPVDRCFAVLGKISHKTEGESTTMG